MGRARSSEGISGLGMILSMAGLLAVLLIVAIVVSVTLPSNTTTNDTIASTVPAHAGTTAATPHGQPATTTAGVSGTPSAADDAACRSDVSDVQAALAAYQASSGSYPSPPAVWSARSYPTNFGPLTNAPPPGPFLKMPPGDNHYVIMWDSSGRIWVEAPGTFSPTYDAANDGANASTCTRVAR